MGQRSQPGRQVSARAVFYDRDTYRHIWNENFGEKGRREKKIGMGLKKKRKKIPKDSLNKTHPAPSACHPACVPYGV